MVSHRFYCFTEICRIYLPNISSLTLIPNVNNLITGKFKYRYARKI